MLTAWITKFELTSVSVSGYRWRFIPVEGMHYFPADEPLIDLFAFYDGAFVCPCQQFAVEVENEHGLTLASLREQAQWHIDEKHGGR